MTHNIRREAVVAIGAGKKIAPVLERPDNFSEIFGQLVFNERVQKQRLPPSVFRSLQETIKLGRPIDPAIAETVATIMKDWAIEHGATHYTHWFQPMTGSTAEKHDSFITPTGGGETLSKFSGLELIRGESDASSFPSGGLRATFEARGYTAWDPTSPAFILRHPNGAMLVIPTLFVSWNGEALDKKIPLLRSIKAVGKQAIRILRMFGNKTALRVEAAMGAEQEYFLIDQRLAALRPDLLITGRTLFGARPPKGQELNDNYFGAIPERVLAFMTELEHELVLLGVPVKTRHNEAAPGQFELAPMYEAANLATDHQMLIMQLLKSIAARHGLLCLLHEKPFAGVNGSGKHNNWSLITDEGENLFSPGSDPWTNYQFLLFCTAVLRAVHKYGNLIRTSVCGAGNDQRLGGLEAPPSVISVVLGGTLDKIFEHLASGKFIPGGEISPLDLGLPELPVLARDASDRNRTSPFAFTGNKFEFRAVGASQNPAGSTTILNAVVADSLSYYADHLEKAITMGVDFKTAVQNLIVEEVRLHKDVLFSGDSYSDRWVKEAKKRGLSNLASTADCLPFIDDQETVDLLTRMNVYKESELKSRFGIVAENYITVVRIEANTALEMAGTQILPAALKYKKAIVDIMSTEIQKNVLIKLDHDIDHLIVLIAKLKEAVGKLNGGSLQKKANICRDFILPALQELRTAADDLEEIVNDEDWPLPTYTELLFMR
ncbi:MAG: glutamine synthetase III [Planctomycetia bacterium]|nr:glutamine synthetase III [Planctomycetia bacterium]